MAGHLPIKKKIFYHEVVIEARNNRELMESPLFTRIKSKRGGKFQRLPVDDYRMDEEHGKVDKYVFAYTPSNGGCIYELHLNGMFGINQVYLVM